MENLEYLKKVKEENVKRKIYQEISEHEIEYRKMKALEIIAEQMINLVDYVQNYFEK